MRERERSRENITSEEGLYIESAGTVDDMNAGGEGGSNRIRKEEKALGNCVQHCGIFPRRGVLELAWM